jgi:hypothetical protein
MSEQQFDIIFRGDIVFGHQLAEVKVRLQQLFKTDVAKIDALFTGRPVPLKRGLDQASAQKYKDVLIKAGAQVELVAVGGTATEPPQPQAIPPKVVEAHSAPLTLAQRLAVQEAEAEQKAQQEAARRAQEAGARPAAQLSVQVSSTSEGDWSLAPTGADLLKPGEKHEFIPRDIDTSNISLREATGNLVDARELPAMPPASVVVPNYDVAAAGSDLIRQDEKHELPLPEIELQDWDIADAGSDLINEDEKIIQPAAVVAIPDFGIAPAGADLGQLKPVVKAVVPDISKITLAD